MSNNHRKEAIKEELKTIVSGLTLQERRNMFRTYQVMKDYGREACLKAMDILDENPEISDEEFWAKIKTFVNKK